MRLEVFRKIRSLRPGHLTPYGRRKVAQFLERYIEQLRDTMGLGRCC